MPSHASRVVRGLQAARFWSQTLPFLTAGRATGALIYSKKRHVAFCHIWPLVVNCGGVSSRRSGLTRSGLHVRVGCAPHCAKPTSDSGATANRRAAVCRRSELITPRLIDSLRETPPRAGSSRTRRTFLGTAVLCCVWLPVLCLASRPSRGPPGRQPWLAADASLVGHVALGDHGRAARHVDRERPVSATAARSRSPLSQSLPRDR